MNDIRDKLRGWLPWFMRPIKECTHVGLINHVTPKTQGCEECLQSGDKWVHLRMCLICGHVGCCDQSKNKHATRHFHETGHPIIQSMEPGEDWRWCYLDEMVIPDREAGQG
jgi:uncharacterized UBP type Zn finger protein